MLKKFFSIALLSIMLSGCYSSSGQILLFNRYSLYGTSPSVIQVQRGDTLYSLARRYDVSVKELAEANNLKPPYALKVGQMLRLSSVRYHTVQKGDTLSSIARKYNLNVRELGKNNGLEPPYSLRIGQKIALNGSAGRAATAVKSKQTAAVQNRKSGSSAPSAQVKKRTTKFEWPVKGKIISNFGVTGKGRKNDGINISAPRGTAVKAADRGSIAYAGNGLKGFGNLILIKHPDGWITAYAHNEKILVKKGQQVRKGEKIATVGSSGGVNSPQLHFEVRAGKKAVNPRNYLP